MSRTKKLIVWILLAIPVFVLVGELAMAGKPPALPNVRYRIKYVELPQADGSGGGIFGMNNLGQVVGHYPSSLADRHAFLYDPLIPTGNPVIDLHELHLPGAEGYRLAASTDVNEQQVVVGYLIDALGNQQGFAVDWGADDPVVDLLPTLGDTKIWKCRINNNGDILIAYMDASGADQSFLFNPGIYDGSPGTRALRNGLPQDYSGVLATDSRVRLLPLDGQSPYFKLNNPTAQRAAQIAGITASGLAFRYTVGGSVQLFPELRNPSWLVALNDDGTFCGQAEFRSNDRVDPFRCNTTVVRLVTTETQPFTNDMNFSRDVVTSRQVYRDDWGKWVALDSLVVGSQTDLTRWSAGYPVNFNITNRTGAANAGIIAGQRNGWVILTPELAK